MLTVTHSDVGWAIRKRKLSQPHMDSRCLSMTFKCLKTITNIYNPKFRFSNGFFIVVFARAFLNYNGPKKII